MKNIYTKLEDYIKEAYVDKDGNLKDMDNSPSSDQLWDDKEFIRITQKNLDYGKEMPEKMYNMISDVHKELYRKELLKIGQMIGYSENESLLNDLINYDYEELYKSIIEWVELFPEMGDDLFPIDYKLIKKIDKKFQKDIINKLIKLMKWPIHIDLKLFKAFHPEVQDLIEANDGTSFLLPS